MILSDEISCIFVCVVFGCCTEAERKSPIVNVADGKLIRYGILGWDNIYADEL